MITVFNSTKNESIQVTSEVAALTRFLFPVNFFKWGTAEHFFKLRGGGEGLTSDFNWGLKRLLS